MGQQFVSIMILFKHLRLVNKIEIFLCFKIMRLFGMNLKQDYQSGSLIPDNGISSLCSVYGQKTIAQLCFWELKCRPNIAETY